jgi:hypothetical protein
MTIEFVQNGTVHRVEARPDESFLETLRERCGITSLKDGCRPQGQCGCCVALVDGLPKTTCAMPARVADGKHIVTLDGLPEAERQQIADCFTATAALPDGSILAHGVNLGAAPMPRATTHINLDAIRAEATSEALRLCSRMADL